MVGDPYIGRIHGIQYHDDSRGDECQCFKCQPLTPEQQASIVSENLSLRASNAALAGRCAAMADALRFARERIAEDRRTLNAISDSFQARSDKADLVDARAIQDRVDAETFKIIDRALSEETPWPLEWKQIPPRSSDRSICYLGKIQVGRVLAFNGVNGGFYSAYDDAGNHLSDHKAESEARAAVEATVRKALEGK